MRASKLSGLLKKGDRVAVSNITGREASEVSAVSQKYCGNIVGGWALGRGGQKIETLKGSIPVYATFDELLKVTPRERHPNKILIYSPPEAVYGEVKEVVKHGARIVETVFIITEHVSIEVTAKIHKICSEKNIDVIGCNTLGIVNSYDMVRIGAVGGEAPENTFKPGSVTVISNSGNMANTISSYLLSAGIGTVFGISTGKDRLILTPLKDFLKLAETDDKTRVIVLYIEPGGTYEHNAIDMMKKEGFSKPLVVYVAGEIAERYGVSLGHAGSVVEGDKSRALSKKKAFDGYFGTEPFLSGRRYGKKGEAPTAPVKGIRVNVLHDIPAAVTLVMNTLGLKKDFSRSKPIRLNPWFVNLGEIGKRLPADLALPPGVIPEPFSSHLKDRMQNLLKGMIRQPMRDASHASSNDGATPRIYGYSLLELMKKRSFIASLILYWTGDLPGDDFEERIAEMTLIAALTNGPGTISAQGAKLSTSAGNTPNTAMIATLASIGDIHGGNGAKAVRYLLRYFGEQGPESPYDKRVNIRLIAEKAASDFKLKKQQAKDAGTEYERIPCLGHPVFKNNPVNYDPREQEIYEFIKNEGRVNIFLEFYHGLARALKNDGVTRNVLAVNIDAAIACIWLGICWPKLREKRMTVKRAMDIPFISFALGRAAGGAGEFLDHQDFGTEMDMRVPVSECRALSSPRKIGQKGYMNKA
ncbi:MAG: hypothetical protein GXP33_04545 [Spirochaetes bacterium]|nr:hypothetical protein [Spirochaetota bacterium]